MRQGQRSASFGRWQRIMGLALVTGLMSAGAPSATYGSCAAIPIVTAELGPGRVLLAGTVVGMGAEGAVVEVHRWLVGPVGPTPVVVQGRASNNPNTWSSVDWEPQVGQAWVIVGTPDETGVIHTSLCSTIALTPEVWSTIDATFGPMPSASPATVDPAAPSPSPAQVPSPSASAGL